MQFSKICHWFILTTNCATNKQIWLHGYQCYCHTMNTVLVSLTLCVCSVCSMFFFWKCKSISMAAFDPIHIAKSKLTLSPFASSSRDSCGNVSITSLTECDTASLFPLLTSKSKKEKKHCCWLVHRSNAFDCFYWFQHTSPKQEQRMQMFRLATVRFVFQQRKPGIMIARTSTSTSKVFAALPSVPIWF